MLPQGGGGEGRGRLKDAVNDGTGWRKWRVVLN